MGRYRKFRYGFKENELVTRLSDSNKHAIGCGFVAKEKDVNDVEVMRFGY